MRHALWLLGLFSLLSGIVGMHGMNSHGAAAMGAHPPVHGVATERGADLGGSIHDATGATAAEVSRSAVPVIAHAVGAAAADLGGGMGGMCVAILVLALIIRLWAQGGAPILPMSRILAAPVQRLAACARDPDPPSLIQLSIQRC